MNVIETWYRSVLRLLTVGRDPDLPEELAHLDARMLRDIGYEPDLGLRPRGWDR